MIIRKLSNKEQEVLEFLVAHSEIVNKRGIHEWLANCECRELSDGEMGSIQLINASEDNLKTKFSHAVVECEFTDKDGVKVIISLNISNNGYPYELDFWKVDFEPLIGYPAPGDLKSLKKLEK
jgi:hypothetical protein